VVAGAAPNHGSGKEQGIRIRKKYYIDRKYSARFFLEDASYSLGNEFSRWIDSFGEEATVVITVKSIPTAIASRRLKAMRAERSSELRVNRSVDARNEKIRSELPVLDRMLNSTGVAGNSLLDLSICVKLSSEHPANLQRTTNRFLMSMDLLGLKFRSPDLMRRRDLSSRLFGRVRKKYLVDSEPLASMLPIFLAAEPDTSGMIIGTDSSTGMPIFMNQMKEASHNMLIIGETGSGKSYFGKILLMRSLISGVCRRAIIVDPLDEYSTDYFGNDTAVIDATKGEYVDFFEFYPEESRISEALTFVTDTLSLDDEDSSLLRRASATVQKYEGIATLMDHLAKHIEDDELNDRIRYLRQKFFRHRIDASLKDIRVTIIRAPSEPGQERDRTLAFALTTARYIARSDNTDKVLLLDEMHLYQNNVDNARFLANLFRNSRHFNTSVIGITQNSYDLEGSQYANTIRDNSIATFLFRTRSVQNTGNDRMRFEYFSIQPELLAGGKNYDYSECFMIFKNRIKKVHVTATAFERKTIPNSSPAGYASQNQEQAKEYRTL